MKDSSAVLESGIFVVCMKLEGYEFEYIGDINPLRSTDGSVRQFMPQARYQNGKGLALNRYGSGPFCKFTIPSRFQHSGVYLITIDGEIRYVGECANLSRRFNHGYGNISPKNCFKGGQETNCRLNHLLYIAAAEDRKISLFFYRTGNYKLMETALRVVLNAAWNRV